RISALAALNALSAVLCVSAVVQRDEPPAVHFAANKSLEQRGAAPRCVAAGNPVAGENFLGFTELDRRHVPRVGLRPHDPLTLRYRHLSLPYSSGRIRSFDHACLAEDVGP